MTTPKTSRSLLSLTIPIGSALAVAGFAGAAVWWFSAQEFVTRRVLESAVSEIQSGQSDLRSTVKDLTVSVSALGREVSELQGRLRSR